MTFPIIYFGNDWNAENRTSSHHIAARLAKKHPLLYVDSPGLRAPKASGRDVKKLVKKLGQAAALPRKVGAQTWHMVLPQFPFRRLPLAPELNRELGALLVRRAARHLGMERPLLWFAVPHPGILLGRLGERFSVYYCIDDYSALPDVDKDQIRGMDRHLTENANQVFVSAQTLFDAKTGVNKNLVYSPHGVDVEHFGRAASEALEIAAPARNLKHPVIGFFGLIEGWIDLELLQFLAKSRPSWTFLLIGRVAVDVSALEKLGNVIFPGPQPYGDLPSWARAFDVAIYPGGQNEFVRNANPLKIREYLATGKPVVSVSSREVERFRGVVRIAKSHEEFLREIDDALANDTAEAREERLKKVSTMSWDARVDEVVAQVEATMAGR
jgi:glycosyltransferase involved in cell wall biosynthesis